MQLPPSSLPVCHPLSNTMHDVGLQGACWMRWHTSKALKSLLAPHLHSCEACNVDAATPFMTEALAHTQIYVYNGSLQCRQHQRPAQCHVPHAQHTGSTAHADTAEPPPASQPADLVLPDSPESQEPDQGFLEALEGLSERIGARDEANEGDLSGFMPRQGRGRGLQVTGESLADSTQRAKRKGRRGGAEVVHQIPAEALPKVCFHDMLGLSQLRIAVKAAQVELWCPLWSMQPCTRCIMPACEA